MNDTQNDHASLPAAGAPQVMSMAQLAAQFKKLEGRLIYAGNVTCLRAGNDYTLIFQRPHPGVMPDGQIAPFALPETAAILNVSVATLKDLQRLLTEHLAAYENAYGRVETEFTRRMDQQAKVVPGPAAQQ